MYPDSPDEVPPTSVVEAGFLVRFASTPEDLNAVQRFRCDDDGLDGIWHHLMAIHQATGRLAATCRLQTSRMAERRRGFHSRAAFEMSHLPPYALEDAVELGRTCIQRDFRNGPTLVAMWRGLADYMTWNRKRFVFGCCSVPTIEPTKA